MKQLHSAYSLSLYQTKLCLVSFSCNHVTWLFFCLVNSEGIWTKTVYFENLAPEQCGHTQNLIVSKSYNLAWDQLLNMHNID